MIPICKLQSEPRTERNAISEFFKSMEGTGSEWEKPLTTLRFVQGSEWEVGSEIRAAHGAQRNKRVGEMSETWAGDSPPASQCSVEPPNRSRLGSAQWFLKSYFTMLALLM